MTEDLRTLVAQVTHLHEQVKETGIRLRRDTELLTDLQKALEALLPELRRPARAIPIPPSVQTQQQRIIRLTEVCRTVGLARSTIWAMVSDGRFPVPRRLGPRAVGWLNTEVDAWMTSRSPSASASGHAVDE